MDEFDIELLLGTPHGAVFEQQCRLHPGTRRLLNVWDTVCQCGDGVACMRESIQDIYAYSGATLPVMERWFDFIAEMHSVAGLFNWEVMLVWLKQEVERSKMH